MQLIAPRGCFKFGMKTKRRREAVKNGKSDQLQIWRGWALTPQKRKKHLNFPDFAGLRRGGNGRRARRGKKLGGIH